MGKRLIVVGGVAAGMSAAAKAKRTDRDLEVVVYEKGPYISYAACGMPYYIAGDVADFHELIVRTPEQMAKQGVTVHIRHEVMSIDAEGRAVTVQDLEEGRTFTEPYDRLVVATGARAAWPSLPGSDRPGSSGSALDGIFGLRPLESGVDVKRFVQEQQPKKAMIVGGGYIGIEMAETFCRLGMDVTMIVRSGKVMRATLDDDVRERVHAELAHHGVKVVQGTPTRFEGQGAVESVLTSEGQNPCDVVMLGVGARPNVELAHEAGVALGPTGAIAADDQMRTNLTDVYAAGDCCEALHLVTGAPAYVPLGSTANKQGRVAGENAAKEWSGGGKATFGGIVGTMVVRCFDLAVASTGLSAARARTLGYTVEETLIQAKDLSHYFPGVADIHVKLVVDGGSGRLLGGQLVGPHRSVKRIDILATALHNRMTVSDLQRLDLSYAPPFSPVWDPILVAANVASR
jgi:NADPH-dependent 2,4-dienoyl-CoA reductase/sulfur reductase-like enzyme